MKNILIFVFFILSFTCLSQTTPRVLLGQKGILYKDTIRNLNLASPIYAKNDSTIAINDTIVSFSKNGTGDSIILTLANGLRYAAASAASGGAGGGQADSAYFWSRTGNVTNAATDWLGTKGNTSLRFRTNNVQTAILDSNGRFGIGTNAPTNLVDINQTANSAIRYSITNPSTGTAGQALFQASNGSGVSFQEGGVTSSGFTTNGLLSAATAYFQNNSGSSLLLRSIAGSVYTNPPIIFGVGTNGNTEAMRIFSNASVSINAPADSSNKLVVNGTGKIVTSLQTPIIYGNSTTAGTLQLSSNSTGTKTNINFGTSTYDELNNRLGIGLTAPVYGIDLTKTTNGAERISVTNSSTGTGAIAINQAISGSASTSFGTAGSGYTTSNGLVNAGTSYFQSSTATKMLFRNLSGAGSPPIIFDMSDGTTDREVWRMDFATGNLSNTGAAGTAGIHLKSGTATAGSAPLKLAVGLVPTKPILLTTPEKYAIEVDSGSTGGHIYFTNAAGTRLQIDRQSSFANGQATLSGTGSATSFTIAHGLSGVTSTSRVFVTPRNAATAGWTYATVDATNITIFYTVAPASGSNNLLLDYQIIP